ncbi:MAG: hypothetical protein HY651_09055 [Acidobacteria bacterium]|nr:hypothetical protein [Acidobacteriota bacterium]
MGATNQPPPDEEILKQVRGYYRQLDYSKADAKKLLADALWAHFELQKIDQQYGFLRSILTTPTPQNSPEDVISKLAEQSLDFMGRAQCLKLYFFAVRDTTTTEINTRINRNQINRYFGLFKLAIMGVRPQNENLALQHLHELASGIAANNNWHHPEGNLGWASPTNRALLQALKDFRDLDVPATFEKMIERGFSIVGRTIKNKLKSEIEGLYRQNRLQLVDPAVLRNVAARNGNPEVDIRYELLAECCMNPPDNLPAGERAILASVAQVISQPDWERFSTRELRAAIVKGGADLGKLTLPGARKARERIAARKDWLYDQVNELAAMTS